MRSNKVHICGSSIIALIIGGLAIDPALCRLQPAENVFPTDVNKALLPNVRQGLNDCHLRYHKYGDYNLIYPIFGVPVRLGEFAHMAAIGWTGPNGAIDFSCGGSLITARHVMTGAHCASRDGVPPDVVRLGVIHINTTLDDPKNEFAQQYKIERFQRHPEHKFSSFYFDIAIITLERTVTINDVVTPACLWNQPEVDFPRLEAVGFGQTSYAGDKTPILLKVQLSPISNDECAKFHNSDIRKLRSGIVDTQVCARDSKMDTCLGDSGGPLQIKLMSNHRSTPYVVGITSFGVFCGTAAPSVYTRVSSYISWLETETGESFAPETCAARYIQMREADESMVTNRVGDHVFIEPEKSYMDIEIMAKHRVYLGYTRGNRIQWNCGGVLINEDYVLTVAHCDKFVFNLSPSHVKVGDLDIHKDQPEAQIVRIAQFIKHPKYREGNLENDIALVKLATDVRFGPDVVPACLVDNDLTMPMYEMAGLGPYNLNNFLRDNEPISNNNTLVLTRMRVDPTACKHINSPNVMCAQNSKYLVPQTCRVEHGGPLERETWHYDRYYTYVFGLTAAGQDCGFGKEAHFVRTSAHIQWIESIVLGKRPQAPARRFQRQIVFPDDDDYSSTSYSVLGMPCTTAQNAADPIVCCGRSANEEKYSMKKCVSYWKQYKRTEEEEYESIPSEGRPAQEKEYPHVALIGTQQYGRNSWSCTGALISDRYVLTSADCVKSGAHNIVRLGAIYQEKGTQDIGIERIVAYPSYNVGLSTGNLALVRLASKVVFSDRVLPACVWPNHSTVPLKLYTLGVDDGQVIVRPRVARYNQDCRKFYKLNNLVDEEQFCAENYYFTNNSCQDRSGDPLEGSISTGSIKISIVVGISSYNVGCPGHSDSITVYARLSAYNNWIFSIVEA
ncbi:transmembrane protease serine 9 isoform X2 [Aedes aegypti]|uniref:Peptidase S1 domain-containing protein n=1 Tax=Aedes aegypti TaxID=7159 RepID=A0A903V594_AEDAE|nr:transmembrane protease serine 9 isoform X2 [Aedes aegypti]